MYNKRNILRLTTWVHIINILIVFMMYGHFNDIGNLLAPLIGLWGIFLFIYRIFWQFLGFEHSFRKRQISNKRAKIIINNIKLNNDRIEKLTKE